MIYRSPRDAGRRRGGGIQISNRAVPDPSTVYRGVSVNRKDGSFGQGGIVDLIYQDVKL